MDTFEEPGSDLLLSHLLILVEVGVTIIPGLGKRTSPPPPRVPFPPQAVQCTVRSGSQSGPETGSPQGNPDLSQHIQKTLHLPV